MGRVKGVAWLLLLFAFVAGVALPLQFSINAVLLGGRGSGDCSGASKSRHSRHTFNYDLINSPDPTAQVSSVWRIPTVPKSEKRIGYHPTQKPLRLVRRALLASTQEGDLVFDPFCGSGTTTVSPRS